MSRSENNRGYVRTPPQNLEAEQAVISSCIQDGNAMEKCMLILKPEDFYKEIHRIIYSTLVDMYLEGMVIEIPSVVNVLRQDEHLDKVGGVTVLTGFVTEYYVTGNVEYYAKIVKEKSNRRKMLRILMESTTELFSETIEYTDIRTRIFDYVISGEELNLDSDCSINSVAEKLFPKIKETVTGKRVTHYKTGIEKFDKAYGGIEAENLSVIVAREGVGKSNFMLQSALNIAESGVGVGYIALDTHSETILARLINYSMSIPMWKLWGQDCPLDSVINQIHKLNNMKTKDDTPALVIAGEDNSSYEALKVIQWIVMAERKWKLKVFFVDSFSAFDYPMVNGKNDEAVQASVVNKLKSIAFKMNIGILGAVDQNYDGQAKGTSRWRAGAANMWDFQMAEDLKSLKVVAKKIRNGPRMDCTLYPNFEYSSFLSEPRK